MYKCGELNKLVKVLNDKGIRWEDNSSYQTIKTGYGKCDWSFERVMFNYNNKKHRVVCALWKYGYLDKKLLEYWWWEKDFNEAEYIVDSTADDVVERVGI